jgi:hemolysin activation/secretion protein
MPAALIRHVARPAHSRALRALAAAALCACASAHAQTATTTTPPKSTEKSAEFVLKGIVYRGMTELQDSKVSTLTAAYIGRRVTLTDLEKLAELVTLEYRARGFFLAQAIVPQQRIEDGQAEISVLEGRLGKVQLKVAADAPTSEERVRAILAHLPPGAALQQVSYERTMLLLSDLPGLKVQAGLEQGTETGTTDLVVEVSAAPKRWQASIEGDNYGTKASGRERLSASLRYASPFGIGDNFDARLMSSSGAQQTFGRLSYEAPLGGDGLRLGVGFSRVGYELGAQFAALGATGTAQVFDASAVYPLLRSRGRNIFLRAAIETKALRDKTEAVSQDSDKRVNAGSLGITWEARDTLLGGGYVNAGATAYFGRLNLNNDATRSLDQDPSTGYRTEGNFAKLGLTGSRLQSLFGRHNLFVSLVGQLANHNLDPSEKLALGGDRAVRAYPSGEVLVDSGWIGGVEWRYSASDDLVLAVFHDAGNGEQAHKANAGDLRNRRTLRGTGVGLTWSAPWAITLRGAVAWRMGDPPVSDTGASDPRVLVQVQKAF